RRNNLSWSHHAGRFEFCRRRQNLSWAHHREVATNFRGTAKVCPRLVAPARQSHLATHYDAPVVEYNAALKVNLRVAHRLGELLAKTVNHQGGRPGKQFQSGTVIPECLGHRDETAW